MIPKGTFMISVIQRRTAATLAAMTLAAGLAAVGAPSASASASASASGFSRCPANFSCYFSDPNGGGDMWRAPYGPACFDLGYLNPAFHDRISSVYNRGGHEAHMYNWNGSQWLWVADVQLGEQLNFAAGDPRNDVVDTVCVGTTPWG